MPAEDQDRDRAASGGPEPGRDGSEEALRESEWRLSRAETIARIGNWKLMLGTGQMVFSRGMREIFGIDRETMSVEEVRGLDLPEYHELLDKALLDLTTKGKPYDLEFRIRRARDGAIADIRTTATYDREKGTVLGVVQDITERKEAEAELLRRVKRHRLAAERIEALLAEKDLVLREVHHRLKNNMLSMKSLLHLQAAKFQDAEVLAAFEDAESHLDSMMLLYEQLFQAPDFSEVSVKALLPPLVAQIMANHSHGKPVQVSDSLEDIVVSAKKANALTIMVNELVTNSLKHAFADGRKGRISLTATAQDGRVTIGIGDNGVGLPEGLEPGSSPGFGLVLVGELAKQLGGELHIERGGGTRVLIEFEN
ncbi:MAG TPA: histidine kinase dimerization/phosphoacceptor domain -containing protein [Rectinemataceae bacterium]|nr:histidine kinase dimerization/phosphoacceptor domain -containing protein [Rectinemataceae bacterium]